MEGDEYIQASEESQATQNPRKKKSKLENRRRFSDEQIRSLECIFESESKLEPRKKMQLAQDLELQPRQVAIWFQNRRARWKSKRIEQEYRKLKDEYDNLASRFESLKKENESLRAELQSLTDLMETSHEGLREESTENGVSGTGLINLWAEAKSSFSNPGLEEGEGTHSDDQNEKSKKIVYSENKGYQLQRVEEQLEVPLGSLEKWYSVDPSGFFDQCCSTSQLLDFWN